jgi:hypothetical protein
MRRAFLSISLQGKKRFREWSGDDQGELKVAEFTHSLTKRWLRVLVLRVSAVGFLRSSARYGRAASVGMSRSIGGLLNHRGFALPTSNLIKVLGLRGIARL